MIQIRPDIAIDESELSFTYTTGSGPGGQNVNKVATRATLHFNVAASPSLTDAQRARLRDRLSNRISSEGMMRVVAGQHRTQSANRRAAVERFTELLSMALRPRKPRRKTRPSRSAVLRRLDSKALRSSKKRERGADRRIDRDL